MAAWPHSAPSNAAANTTGKALIISSVLILCLTCRPCVWAVQVTLPSGFSASCDKDVACKANPLSLSTYYYSDSSSVATIEDVIAGLPNAISSLPALTLVSGALPNATMAASIPVLRCALQLLCPSSQHHLPPLLLPPAFHHHLLA